MYEQAKAKAIGGADGLIVTNVQVDYVNGQVCTTVRGRPYSIDRIEAVAPGKLVEQPQATQIMPPQWHDSPGANP